MQIINDPRFNPWNIGPVAMYTIRVGASSLSLSKCLKIRQEETSKSSSSIQYPETKRPYVFFSAMILSVSFCSISSVKIHYRKSFNLFLIFSFNVDRSGQ